MLLLTFGACSSGGVGGLLPGSGEAMIALGDWDDVQASVEVAAGQCEMAVVDSQGTTEVQKFNLLTIKDEPATLEARRVGVSDATTGLDSGPESIKFTARVGRFGDAAQERKLVAAARRRLEQLAGVDTAPIR